MKNSIKYISEYYPKVIKKLEQTDLELNEEEKVFLQLVLFFQSPDLQKFDLSLLYKHFDGEEIRIALNAILTFFKKDTYLLASDTQTFSIINEDELFNQKMFSQYLRDNGYPTMDSRVLNVYYSRGLLPTPDLVIGKVPYWSKAKVVNYAKTLKEERPKLYKGN